MTKAKSQDRGPISETEEITERRRIERVVITGEQFKNEANDRVYSVVDVSFSGMALRLLDPSDLVDFTVGSHSSGMLKIKGKKVPVRFQVRHVRPDLVGVKFEEVSKELKETLAEALSPESLGSELKLFPADQRDLLWYHAPSGADLLIWLKSIEAKEGPEIRRFVLYTPMAYCEWSEELGVASGHWRDSQERSDVRGVLQWDTVVATPDRQADREKIAIAKKLLLSSKLPQTIQEFCVSCLDVSS